MVNVKISNGTYFTEEDYQAFKQDYIHSTLSMNQLKEKHNVTSHNMRKSVSRIIKETGFRRTSTTNRPVKYYVKTRGGKYTVIRKRNNKRTHFGTYDTEEEARKVVDELKKVNWDKNQLKEIQKNL